MVFYFGVVLAVGQGSAREDESVFNEHKRRFNADPKDYDSAWQFAKAAFVSAELARKETERAKKAEEGIAAARMAVQISKKGAAGHLYLALNLGQLARTKLFGALKIVREMERELEESIFLEEALDYAGAHRSLGMLYRDAPGWPISIGNRAKALTHLERAVELQPIYPDNRLSLAEAYMEWNDHERLRDEVRRIESLVPEARRQFAGEQWASAWIDWNARLEALKKRASRK